MVRFAYIFYIILILTGTAYGQLTPGIRSFNAGETSPLFEMRQNFPKYDNACRTLENMLVHTLGPVTRRPGTKYIAEVKDSDKQVRLLPFEYSKTDAYVLEFGDIYMRVYRDGGQVVDANSDPYDINTPYDETDLFGIQYVQSADVMYLVHPNHPPQKLSRTGHTDWTIADVNFTTGPYLDENITDVNIIPSDVNGSITLQSYLSGANEPLWVEDHNGALWRISHRREETSLSGILDANESSSTLACSGDYDFITHGTWTGTVKLERSFNNGTTWESVVSRNSKDDQNLEHSDTEDEDDVIYRITMSEFESGTCHYNFSVHDYIHNGYVRITGFTDANTVTATVYAELADTNATTTWAQGYWSDANGWPETIEFYEQRLGFGGSSDFPQTLWLSKSDDYENMTAGADADDAVIFKLPGQNPIQWLLSGDFLFIGTLGGMGKLQGVGTDEIISPAEVPPADYKQQSTHGSQYIQAVPAGSGAFYVARGGTKIRQVLYSLEHDRFVTPDMTVLAEHITSSGIIEIDYQTQPDSILWCIRDDGTLLTLTQESDQRVTAWSRHITDGYFESVCVVPGSNEDEIWLVVRRTIDGNTKRYIEQMQARDWGMGGQVDCFFVDSGLSFDGGDAVSISGVTRANPAVVTVSTWPVDGSATELVDGQQIKVSAVVGMTELNDNIYTIDDANVAGLNFTLNDSTDAVDINSIGFTTYTSGGTVQRFENTFANLTHLEGKEVSILADGQVHQNMNVASATIQLSRWANKVHAGLPYTSVLETLPLKIELSSGLQTAKKKRISEVAINFYESLNVEYGSEAGDVQNVEFYDAIDLDERFDLYTGFRVLDFLHGYDREGTVYLQQQWPMPMTIRGIIPKVEIYE